MQFSYIPLNFTQRIHESSSTLHFSMPFHSLLIQTIQFDSIQLWISKILIGIPKRDEKIVKVEFLSLLLLRIYNPRQMTLLCAFARVVQKSREVVFCGQFSISLIGRVWIDGNPWISYVIIAFINADWKCHDFNMKIQTKSQTEYMTALWIFSYLCVCTWKERECVNHENVHFCNY